MDRRHTLKLSAALVASALLAACGQQETPQAAAPAAAPVTTQTVKLGFAAPLTGAQAHYGKEMQNGIVLALEEVNAEKPMLGGQPVQFELVSEDDQADPKQGTSVAQKLVDAKIQGMLGHFNSGTSIPASRVYMEAGIPQIAMATSPAYTAQGFKDLTYNYFMDHTGIPINFGIAVGLGFFIGTAIAGQTFYSFTLENLRYFGTLKAMGAGNGVLLRMILLQAVLAGALGWGMGVGAASAFGYFLGDTELSFKLTGKLLAVSAASIGVICVFAALLSIRKVMRLEPAIVFKG